MDPVSELVVSGAMNTLLRDSFDLRSHTIPTTGFVVSIALALTACGPPKVYKGPIRTEAKPAVVAVSDLSLHGTPVELGQTIEITGYRTVWFRGTRLLVTLEKTAWEEVAGDRDGRATLKTVMDEASGKTETRLTIDEDASKDSKGFRFKVLHADEVYEEARSTYSPQVKFVVTRLGTK
ncbi:MAG: hypothetical protein ACI9OJ_003326 [Myxococcota bacterium]